MLETDSATHTGQEPPLAPTGEPLLVLDGVSKRYRGEYALKSANFTLFGGEIHALLGENGAGKSTLAKIISGATDHDEGIVRYDGEERNYQGPLEARRAGVSMVYQETSLVDSMTVAQNLVLGDEKPFNRLSSLNIFGRELLESHNFHIHPDVLVATLGSAQKQMVEVARCVHRESKLVIFDEPTSSVTPEEKQQLFFAMQLLKRKGVGLIFITHNIEEALTEADRITILRDGEMQGTFAAAELTRAQIVQMMVGRKVEYQRHPPNRRPDPKPVLQVEDVSLPPIVRRMSFAAHGGEIIGLAGLVGAGRSEVAHILAGVEKRRRIGGGVVRLEGKPVRYRTPRAARRDGIAYVTEDRKLDGFFDDMSVVDNVYLGDLGGKSRVPWAQNPRRQRKRATTEAERFKVRTINPTKAKLVELSGGNQQKVVLARGLSVRPKVAIVDEPTRGVDVGAIGEIHAAIRELADSGVAVIVISSYLPEILAISDRILVARGGQIVAEFDGETATEEELMFAAVH